MCREDEIHEKWLAGLQWIASVLSLAVSFHDKLSQINPIHSHDLSFLLQARDPPVAVSTIRFSPALQAHLLFVTDPLRLLLNVSQAPQTQHVQKTSFLPEAQVCFSFLHPIIWWKHQEFL